ncbi:hypothetical protein [Chryseobacterium sp. CCH4-E10]|uniref:hypothetical protein n=1 Tax=Chryseobacterium sp. CCH4-E10 TaxID=1768758 RepID=UPI000832C73E|nr:hypothetical protein [Chryseobacterium sp. CCH4-E10]
MKKAIKYLIIPSILLFYIQSCISDVKVGAPYYSSSIEISKKEKIFVSKYRPIINEYIQNGKKYKILEVWSEKESYIKNADMDLDIKDNIRFIIRFDKDFGGINDIIETKKRLTDKLNVCGFTNKKMFFIISSKEQRKDTIKLYFINNNHNQLMQFVKIN